MDEPNVFYIEYQINNEVTIAEVKPCCQADDMFYYDISINNTYQFTITPGSDEKNGFMWRLALKNSDKQVDAKIVQLIGEQIEQHNIE